MKDQTIRNFQFTNENELQSVITWLVGEGATLAEVQSFRRLIENQKWRLRNSGEIMKLLGQDPRFIGGQSPEANAAFIKIMRDVTITLHFQQHHILMNYVNKKVSRNKTLIFSQAL